MLAVVIADCYMQRNGLYSQRQVGCHMRAIYMLEVSQDTDTVKRRHCSFTPRQDHQCYTILQTHVAWLIIKKIKPCLPSGFALEQGNMLVAPSEKHLPFEHWAQDYYVCKVSEERHWEEIEKRDKREESHCSTSQVIIYPSLIPELCCFRKFFTEMRMVALLPGKCCNNLLFLNLESFNLTFSTSLRHPS